MLLVVLSNKFLLVIGAEWVSLLVFILFDLADFKIFFEDVVGEVWNEGKEGREEGSGEEGDIGEGGNSTGRGEGSDNDGKGEYSLEWWRMFFLLYVGSVFDNGDICFLYGSFLMFLFSLLLSLFLCSLLLIEEVWI